MKEFRGKTAVITGAASGIGRAVARRCASLGMRVVVADVEREALAAVAAGLRAGGATVLASVTDVSSADQVDRLARKVFERFGTVHLLFNNAGVATVGPAVWESTRSDCDWVLGVNLIGAVHGLRAFLPTMLEQQTEGHIVNTASVLGLAPRAGMGIYAATKAGVVALTEALHQELAARRAPIRVSVLCPGLVNTRLLDASRNRPEQLRNDPRLEKKRDEEHAAYRSELRKALDRAMSPDEMADHVLAAIRDERFYVFAEVWVKEWFQSRARHLLREREPWTPPAPETRSH